MKGQSHLTISATPILWHLAPPIMYGLCGAEVPDPIAVDTWGVSIGKPPEFDPFKTCPKCVTIAFERKVFVDETEEDERDEWTPAPFYVYALANRRDVKVQEVEVRLDVFPAEILAEQQHNGDTIAELDDTVTRVGFTKTPSNQ